ncbi:2-hydroxyisoflavanone dehydratase-like [Lotus japonicus]|uniref:2-hydroxyisoflavanone dehydratase-like n=1 Tax=Lotus japonicus TaxID=34305 RepID=UPI00258D4507|nr:2-hydroxyisoflavanone dehydratase-like [Lotus japonicus]
MTAGLPSNGYPPIPPKPLPTQTHGGDSAGGNIVHNIAMHAGIEVLPEPIIEPEQNIDHKIWSLVYPSAPGGVDNPMLNPVGPGAPSLATLGCSRIIVCVPSKDRLKDRAVRYYEAMNKSGWQGKLELFEEEDEDHIYHLFKPESESAKS